MSSSPLDPAVDQSQMNRMFSKILVTGGAGYVGSALIPQLLRHGFHVTVIDLFLFGDEVLPSHPNLTVLHGDVRDRALLRQALKGVEAVIHLAGISNDPSVALDPSLSREINLNAFRPLLEECHAADVQRFIFASSASVYGISDRPSVTEEHPLVPVSLYNQLKAECEQILFAYPSPPFSRVAVRPATLSGWSPRMRFDLTVNILTAQALERGAITVFGGDQRRPCLHLQDMVELYHLLLRAPTDKIDGQVFNVGCENLRVTDVANTVKQVVDQQFPARNPVRIETLPSDDPRSYHICSDKLQRELGFMPRHTIVDAIRELSSAFRRGLLVNALTNERFYNIRVLKQVQTRLCQATFMYAE